MLDANTMGLILIILIGFAWGSVATMATYRLPRGKPWIGDKPRCLLCKHELNIIDYFSVFSYFIWRGKCRYCGGKYECSFSYFVTEFAITSLFVLVYLQYGFSDLLVLLTLFVVAVVILAVVDAENKFIPAKILISLLMIGVVYRTFIDQTFYGALYGGIIAGITGLAIRHIYFIAIGKGSIGSDYKKWQEEDRFKGPGFDYLKLLAICGVYLPLPHFIMFVVITISIALPWRLIAPNSLRIGTLMVVPLTFMVIYPEFFERLWLLAF